MSRYAIWNKIDAILTPVGEVLTAEQWIERYPVAGVESITVVCAGGEINGAFFGTLGSMVERCEREGCDFSDCNTAEEKLAKLEAFEDEKKAKTKEEARARAEAEAANAELNAASLASIAANLEFQSMMALEDVEA